MEHNILVLYFGAQCPWYIWVIEQARRAAQIIGAELTVKNVMNHHELAEKYRMFFPFMTIVDENIRIPSPVNAEMLVQITRRPRELKPTLPMPYGQAIEDCYIRGLTQDNIMDIIPLCMERVHPIADKEKKSWVKALEERIGESLVGFVAYKGGKAQAVVECIPTTLVPYPLPYKDSSVAFITCIYPTKQDIDYRSHVLKKLVGCMKEKGRQELQVIAGRRTPYPNGPCDFFREHGFVELKEVDHIGLMEGEEDLILMSKGL